MTDEAENFEPPIDPAARISVHPLTIRPEGDDYVVGRIELAEFVVLPAVGVRVIELLRTGLSIRDAQETIASEGGGDVDVEEFVRELAALGFIEAVAGDPVPQRPELKPSLPRLQPGHVRWIFSRPMKLGFLALVLAATVTVIRKPSLIPGWQNFFWDRDADETALVLVVNTSVFVAGTVLHELAHLVAARSRGIPGRFGLATRLSHLVFQTDLTSLWAVPRGQRYRVYWAGILWDLILISVGLLVLGYVATPSIVENLLLAMVLLMGLGLLRQFLLYMRTDVYLVVLDAFRCGNLFNDALAYAGFLVRRFGQRIWPRDRAPATDPRLQLSEHERRVVTLYAWIVVVGSPLTLVPFLFLTIPIVVTAFQNAVVSTIHGAATRDVAEFLNGITALAIEGFFTGALIIVFVRSHPRALRLVMWPGRQWTRLARS